MAHLLLGTHPILHASGILHDVPHLDSVLHNMHRNLIGHAQLTKMICDLPKGCKSSQVYHHASMVPHSAAH